ncbi:methyltransferase [Amycolatopsis deserti]|uniref:Methyltransferase n=1 Tax=Amycolatopsis deserti TaxID=185696 RepID=A0ABQ3INK8_9PSEU|nr:methyltransferase [Amycolatopsis deserti]GHE89645.1 methyltransferase [Amycolatopsis deserti]
MAADPPDEFVELIRIARAHQLARALSVAAELGVADLLRDGPRSTGELAATTRTHAPSLYRLLRALASLGIFHEDAGQRFGLTAMGEYLRRDHPLSVDPLARMLGSDYQWRVWGELSHSVRTGEVATVHALGTGMWDYFRQHPRDQEIFDAAMRTVSRGDHGGILEVHDFSRYRVVADVGGGSGALLADVLTTNPSVRGILLDQPQVTAGADALLRACGVADRVRVVPGDFFDSVPEGADAYLLAHILHDWPDDDAGRILRCVRAAMHPEARLLVVDAVLGPPNEDPAGKFLDLMMLVFAGGRERTEPEWRALLAGAGFECVAITRATPRRHVIEAAVA